MLTTLSSTAIVSYEKMVADPRAAVTSISGWLGFELPAEQVDLCIEVLSRKAYKDFDGGEKSRCKT
jgi:hypothetical protein